MSGRLVILGKKGYCPWNSKNLDRIKRDEEEHRKTQEREQEKQADKASVLRLAALKRKWDEKEPAQQRFNLFESEEKACLDRGNGVQGSRSQIDERINNERITQKIEGKNDDGARWQSQRFGDHSFGKHGKSKKFYMEPCSIKEPLGEKEIRRHQQMDPMREFHEDKEAEIGIPRRREIQSKHSDHSLEKLEGRMERRSSKLYQSVGDSSFERSDEYTEGTKKRQKKKKRRRREDSNSDSHRKSTKTKTRQSSNRNRSSTDSMEELRRKRAEREQHERQRQDAVLKTAKHLSREI